MAGETVAAAYPAVAVVRAVEEGRSLVDLVHSDSASADQSVRKMQTWVSQAVQRAGETAEACPRPFATWVTALTWQKAHVQVVAGCAGSAAVHLQLQQLACVVECEEGS